MILITLKQEFILHIAHETKIIKEKCKKTSSIEYTAEYSIEKIPARAKTERNVAVILPEKENIKIDVEPRTLNYDNNIGHASNGTNINSKPEIIDVSKNDMIYFFANTSLSKKTKLREVFRKATRILDRVTSVQ